MGSLFIQKSICTYPFLSMNSEAINQLSTTCTYQEGARKQIGARRDRMAPSIGHWPLNAAMIICQHSGSNKSAHGTRLFQYLKYLWQGKAEWHTNIRLK